MSDWVVQLTIKATVYISAPDEWGDPDGIGELARAAISLDNWRTDTVVEIDNIRVDDVCGGGPVTPQEPSR